MSVAIYTVEARVSIYNDETQKWGGYTDPKNLLNLTIQKPEPTTIKDVSSKPDGSFGNTTDSYLVSSGSPALTLATRDVINRDSTPVEMNLLAAALAARVVDLDDAAVTNHPFQFEIDQLELNFETGKRNLVADSEMLYKQFAPTTGVATGTATTAGPTTLTDTKNSWATDDLVGKAVMITGGAGSGQVVAITANTDVELTVASWTEQPDNTSTYAIVESTLLTAGTDYTVDLGYGTIKPLSAGNCAVGDIVNGLCDSKQITGVRFRGAAKDSVIFRIKGKGKDIKSGAEGFMSVPRVVAYSSENQEFVANAEDPAFKQLTLTGEIELPDGATEAYTWDDNLTYA